MARIVTASTVQWSDASNFQGALLVLFVAPELGDGNYPRIKPRITTDTYQLPRPLPQRMAIPIVDGVLKKNFVLPKDKLSPPNVKMYDFWIDSENVVIANGSALFEIDTDGDYTITPPTLTAPTAETSSPALSYSAAGVTIAFADHDFESLAGTKDGSNQSFTISRAPDNFMILFYNNIVLQEGTDYTRSGTAITLLTFAPASGANLNALIV